MIFLTEFFKKFLIIIIFLLSSLNITYAFNYDYEIGQKVENEIRFSRKVAFDLEPGEWEVIDNDFWFWGAIKIKQVILMQTEKNRIVALNSFVEFNLSGDYQSTLNSFVTEVLYKDKYDGCYERPEYTLVKKYSKGSSHNCLRIRHIDIFKELYDPDDPEEYDHYAYIRRFIKDNKLELPEITLSSYHAYTSRFVSNKLYEVIYINDPLKLNGPKNNSKSEETSEYHPSNINNHPEHKKFMNDYIEISSSRHINFENRVNALKRHKLKFTNINTTKIQNDEILDQLKKLNSLYKDGVLTKEEFIKAKKKILN